MSDFKAKMHQIVCWLGFCPRPRWWSLQRSPRPSSWILGGLLLRGRGREGSRGKGRGGKGEGRDGEGGGMVGPKLKLGPQNYFPGAGAEAYSNAGLIRFGRVFWQVLIQKATPLEAGPD